MKKYLIPAFAMALAPLMATAVTPLWLRDVKISPDGKQIAFCYKGDIYTVDANGGNARRLTAAASYEAVPVWSPDSKKIAFQSDRYGNMDIFIMPAQGGTPTRLTFNSAAETPEAFSPDGKYVIYSASIQDPASSALFPSSRLTELYQIPVSGGKMEQILGTPAQMLSFLPDNKTQYLYQDTKGMENEWRKHHTSSVARDIVLYDTTTGKHNKLTANHAGEDRNPVAVGGGKYYFLSERDGGSMNVYAASIDSPDNVTAVTNFKSHPVRFLSADNNGRLCFTYDGEIYTLAINGKPAKVAVDVVEDIEDETTKIPVSSAEEMAPSPDGKMMAFTSRGNVFVTAVDYPTTKQITDTPAAEQHLTWGKDSRALYYVSERDGIYAIYEAKIARSEDPNMANATVIEEKPMFKADGHERTVPQISPDGKKMAFVLDRRKLAVRDMESGKVTTLTDGTTTTDYQGTVNYAWSPDSKWIALEVVDRKHDPYSDVAIINVADGKMTNISQSGYFDMSPKWVLDGNAILFESDRYGMRSHASWGSQSDVMIAFLNQEAFDDFNMSKEEAELAKEAKKEKKEAESDSKDKKKGKDKDKKKDEKKDEDSKDADEKDNAKDIKVETDRIKDRIVRLTPFSSSLSDAMVTSNGETLYFITRNNGEGTLWEYDLRERKVNSSKNINSGLSAFVTTPDGKHSFLLGRSMNKFADGRITPISFNGQQRLDHAAEREYMYDFMTREEQHRFYDANMHGVDWPALTKHYRKFLPHINNNYDFSEMLSEILGELNVSHTGSGYRGNMSNFAERTAQLGLLYDMSYSGEGLLVAEVIKGSPFDNAGSKVKAGSRIDKINGQKITLENDYTTLLTDLAGKNTLITITDPATGKSWEEVIKPISSATMNGLLYDRWVENRAADVDRWSNGRLGYVHIASMNDDSYRTIYTDILGKYNDREGIVIDVRNNGGGRLHEDIEVLFSGKKYLTQVVRGQEVCDMPSRRWNKPSIMVTCEACYSNAHGTPWVYKTMGLGKVVGMPVPGTMTSVNWVTLQDPSVYFGIPVVGYRTAEGYYLENHQLEPDIKVANDPAKVVAGEDQQLKAAVDELLRELSVK